MQSVYEALPDRVRVRLGRLRQKVDQERSLLGYQIAAEGLRQLGVKALDWDALRWSAFGRPSLPLGIDFNISHAGDFVACALTSEGVVGIDIEPLRLVNLQGMDQYMNTDQWREITGSPDASAAFLRFWTLKESVVKCEGTGLSLSVRDICFVAGQAALAGRTWHVQPLALAPGLTGALAASKKIDYLAVSHWQT